MPALNEEMVSRLALLEAQHRRRELVECVRESDSVVHRQGKALVSFSCNDYLGLSMHPDVINAAQDAIATYGAGAGASRLVTGNYPLLEQLEEELALFKKAEAACLFGSGYLANLGTIPVLLGKGDLVLADKLSHACMLDGAKLSGADVFRFTHNNVTHCRMMLEAHRSNYRRCLLLTETVFSMDGDCAPIEELAALACEYDAWLMTDDAHGLGVVEETCVHANIRMGTLSKAVGSYGGYVVGSQEMIDLIKTSARSLMFSTALPPASAAAAIASLKIIKAQPERGSRALAHAQRFCRELGLPDATSAIVPLVIGEEEKALEASRALEKEGYLVTAIRPPTVLHGSARLRFTFSASHNDAQLDGLIKAVRQAGLL